MQAYYQQQARVSSIGSLLFISDPSLEAALGAAVASLEIICDVIGCKCATPAAARCLPAANAAASLPYASLSHSDVHAVTRDQDTHS